ncbi:hypothetical protein [Nocardia sp. NPDC050435]|uniref:MinD/ParA family ATP-binding protein n=1 Tax=Nocardia sp. NPDC050435 TaxID=3155040 RepID=UPI0033F9ECE5
MTIFDLSEIDGSATESEDAALTAAPAPGSPTEVPSLNSAGPARWVAAPPVLVLGACGGSGVSTTALGLAGAAATDYDTDLRPVCVDITAYGGDLAKRGADAQAPVGTAQTWLEAERPALPSAVASCTGASSAGARILARGPEPLPRRETALSIHSHLIEAGHLPIYDGGAPVSSRLAAPLLADPRVALVLVTGARPDLINRLQPALAALDTAHGEFLLSRAVLVVTEQIPGTGAAAVQHLSAWLGAHLRAVALIPHDPHLARGRHVSWRDLDGATRTAYRLLWGDLR